MEIPVPIFKERFRSNFPPSLPFIPDERILSKTCFELKGSPLSPPFPSDRVELTDTCVSSLFEEISRRGAKNSTRWKERDERVRNYESIDGRKQSHSSITLYILDAIHRIIRVTPRFRHGFSSLKRRTSTFPRRFEVPLHNKGLGEVMTRHV